MKNKNISKWVPKNGETVIPCDAKGFPIDGWTKTFIGMSKINKKCPYVCQDENNGEYDSYPYVKRYNEASIELCRIANNLDIIKPEYDKVLAEYNKALIVYKKTEEN